jgi:WD40 repeat protein
VSSVLAVDPHLYTDSWDKTIRQWNLATGEYQIFAALDKEVLCLLEHKDIIIAGCRDSQIRVYTKLTREELKDQKMIKHKETVNSLTTVAGNASLTIFSASNDNRSVQWEMTSSGWGDVDDGARADPSLSASLAERIPGSSGVQKAANVKSSVIVQNQLDDSLPKVVKG